MECQSTPFSVTPLRRSPYCVYALNHVNANPLTPSPSPVSWELSVEWKKQGLVIMDTEYCFSGNTLL